MQGMRRCVAMGALVGLLGLIACSKGGSDGGGGGASTYSISGHVMGATDVAIALTGAKIANTTTDSGGNYTFTGLSDGSYTVIATKAGFVFSPESRAVTVSGANVSGLDFTATETQPPTVVSTVPLNDAQGVALGAPIIVTFSEAIAPTSISASSFQVMRGTTQVSGTIVVSGSTITFTPSPQLVGDAVHTVTVTGAVTDLAGNHLEQSYTSSFRTLDNVAPTVVSTAPAVGAQAIALDTQVTVTFSENVDPASVTTGALFIEGVAGAVAVGQNVATFTPEANLDPDAIYTARVTTAVTDAVGNPLAAARVWTFATLDTRPPTIVSRTPAPGAVNVATSTVVTVTFSEPIEPSSVTSTSFAIAGVAGAVSVTGSTATLTPSAPLSANTSYTVTVSTGVTDLAGNALAAPDPWTFRTIDTIAPTIMSTFPASGDTGIDTNATIRAMFSEDVAAASVTSATFKVMQGATQIAGDLAVAGPEVTFQALSQLTKSTPYTVTITTGVTDLSGNALASNASWSFTTVPNTTPIARPGATQDASIGQVVTLDGLASSDPDGDTLSYAWTAPAGVTLSSTTSATPTFTAPSSVTTLTFWLKVTDPQGAWSQAPVSVRVWIDKTKIVLVDGSYGNDANGGGFGAAVRTITRGITLAAAKGSGAGVYVAGGVYNETLTVSNPMGLYGGFSSVASMASPTWTRTLVTTTINSTAVTAVQLRASNTTLDRFTVYAGNSGATGGSSVAVFVGGTTTLTGVQVTNCTLRAGNGFQGATGAIGSNGTLGYSGSNGTGGSCNNEAYSARGRGGAGGTLQVAGGTGGDGGYSGSWAGKTGSAGASSPTGLAGGAGGAGGASGSPGHSGAAGGTGQTGGAGTIGTAGAIFGNITSTGYTAASAGYTGGTGAKGSGGGGGGGGGGQTGTFVDDGAGNGGGGGGGGGSSGAGGVGGTGGGGSFGVLVYYSTVTVSGTSIITWSGGAGGAGGAGGYGGSGGLAGVGATTCSSEIGVGGNGGYGGAGGRGGQGGGGAGGPSIGIAFRGTIVTSTGNTFVLGNAGAGGSPNGVAGLRQATYTY